MKNKFLLMSVVSALFALLIIPSVFAQTVSDSDITFEIQSGLFTLSCEGSYSTSISFSMTTPPITEETLSTTRPYDANYCAWVDHTALDGGMIRMYLDSKATVSGDFYYSGESVGQSDLPASQFKFIAKAGATPTISIDDPTKTFNIISGSTSAGARAYDLYAYRSSNTAGGDWSAVSLTGGASSASHYLEHIATEPLMVQFGIEKLKFVVPGGSNPGEYLATINIVAIDGLDAHSSSVMTSL